ncbi:MAG: response regulator transcription factor [Flavobacteriales bacterium]|nr:response regulator transcription factor [Flavobacteriales bacterium]
MNTIKAIIIDDEPMARQLLKGMLNTVCSNVEVLELCANLPEGVKAIRKFKPNLIFLDIEMPGHSGLELLEFFDENEVDFSIIFTTAYNHYAIRAFKLSAIDYLLKPLDEESIKDAVNRFERNISKKTDFSTLRSNLNQSSTKKIAIHTISSVRFVKLDEILFFKADGSYTDITLENDEKITSSKNLKYFEYVLNESSDFVRCHKSFIVNVNFITSYIKSDGGSFVVNTIHEVAVSPNRVDEILKKLSV